MFNKTGATLGRRPPHAAASIWIAFNDAEPKHPHARVNVRGRTGAPRRLRRACHHLNLASELKREIPPADRIDLLAGNQLRVVDYKTGYPPEKKRALQVPIYALCAQERLREQGRGLWDVDEGSYIAFSGRKPLLQVIKPGKVDAQATLADAWQRLLDVVTGVESGEFPPRPHDPRICSWCAYPSVCRKDYVGDE